MELIQQKQIKQLFIMTLKKNKSLTACKNLKFLTLNLTSKKDISQLKKKKMRNTLVLQKEKNRNNENSYLSFIRKNKPKAEEPTVSNVNSQYLNRNGFIISSSNDILQKQQKGRRSIISEKKQHKYILNSFKNENDKSKSKSRQRNSISTSNCKNITNQTLLRHTQSYKQNTFFQKSSLNQISKIKKKKHDYIKAFSRTTGLQKSKSQIFASSIGSQQFKLESNFKQQKKMGNIIKSKFADIFRLKNSKQNQELQKLKFEHLKKLSEIQLNTKQLFQNLKGDNKSKLQCVKSGYQKIVFDLYELLNKLPSNQKSTPNTISQNNINNCCQHLTPQSTDHESSKTTLFKRSDKHAFISRIPSLLNQSESQSQVQSFSDISFYQNKSIGSKHTRKSSTLSLVKNLNLNQINRSAIKQYHDEFMNMKDQFSHSWKRSLQNEKKF